jgi:hypothetical protein
MVNIKNEFHILIDRFNDDYYLSKFYQLMSGFEEQKDSLLWKNLSNSEKEELMQSLSEAEDINQLVAHEDVLEKYKKWL